MKENVLSNKRILVTGASSGIGRAIALECASEKGDVVIVGRNEERLYDTLHNMKGTKNIAKISDLTDFDSLDSFVKELPELDGMVLCAGLTHTAPVKYNDPESVAKVFGTNILSYIHLIRLLVKYKKINAGASIIFISSLASKKPYVGNSLYSSTKGALNSYAKVLALELASKKIRVNSILPGIIRTKEISAFSDEEMTEQEKKIPFGYGKVTDIANACVFLLSDYACWITGTEMTVDGGQSLN